MLEIGFWVSLVGLCFSYFIYPLVLTVLPVRRKKALPDVKGAPPIRKVSLIVTVHNEAARIREKIENCLALEYDSLEIIVASDASDDGTDDVVRDYGDQGVKLARADARKGKEYAQLQAIKVASGDILVFSDVATAIPEDAIRRMMRYFDDPEVGAVSSEDRFLARDGRIVGEGAYVRYEMWLRKLESSRAGLVGLSGSFFAARRSVCQDWDIYSPSDFNTALNCARVGLVAVTAPDVVGFYQDVADASREYQRKVRTIIRGLTALSRHPEVLNPFKFRLFAFQVFGHKVMRWLAPWFGLTLFCLSVVLAKANAVYLIALVGQLMFLGAVAVAYWMPSLRDRTLLKIPFFFVQANAAVAHAGVSFLSGRRMTVWTPSKR
ncbi:glycosyltransferase family 2 protein [Marinobacter sp.]|uniref:glycosyltransferase family 2 protein n=1 Tax=Marinobacter sp. TaxID=50741 RepID=UPI0035C6E3CD|nr:glycosyltransferase family 2 protein [Methylococcales bacterium]